MDEITIPDVLDGSPQKLHPRTRVVWVVRACLGIGLVVIAAGTGLSTVHRTAALALLGAGLVVGALVATWWARLVWTHWRWAVWDDAVELRYGVVSRRASLVPFHRIQQIDVSRGPLERMLGLSSFVLRTAAATSDARIPGIASEHAEILRRRLLARAGIDDAV